MNSITTEVENIADAISACQAIASSHADSARRILTIVLTLTMALVSIIVSAFVLPFFLVVKIDLALSSPVLYVFLAIYVLAFSVLMAIYRLHVGQVSTFQKFSVGFMRIRVAGSNTTDGYKSEVRQALTKDAFETLADPKSKKGIESPVPGHPGVDLSTAVVNKVLEGIEVVSKRRATKAPRNAADA